MVCILTTSTRIVAGARVSVPRRATALRAAAPARETPTVRAAATGGIPLPPNDHRAIARYLAGQGWGEQWIDLVTENVARKLLDTDVGRCSAVIEYLGSLGLTKQQICNMVSKARVGLLGTPVEDMKAVVDYIAAQGASVKCVLVAHPKLLDYKVIPGGLQKNPRSYAKVYVIKLGDKDSWNVQYYRDDAAFDTAPVAPCTPPN